MDKSIYTHEYQGVLRLLRQCREEAEITQVEIAKRLRMTQSLVSKIERGDRRLDIIELRSFCRAVGIELTDFVARLEKELHKRA